jgi:hypothetical protein
MKMRELSVKFFVQEYINQNTSGQGEGNYCFRCRKVDKNTDDCPVSRAKTLVERKGEI